MTVSGEKFSIPNGVDSSGDLALTGVLPRMGRWRLKPLTWLDRGRNCGGPFLWMIPPDCADRLLTWEWALGKRDCPCEDDMQLCHTQSKQKSVGGNMSLLSPKLCTGSLMSQLHAKCISKLGSALTTLQAVCLLVGCLTSQQQASVSKGRICSDNFTCCHTQIEVADQMFYLT